MIGTTFIDHNSPNIECFCLKFKLETENYDLLDFVFSEYLFTSILIIIKRNHTK